jgi:PAS domain S-box-containing protein
LITSTTECSRNNNGRALLSAWDIAPLRSAPVAIVVVDQAGYILYANPYLEEMFGYQRDELSGQMVDLLIPERFHRAHRHHRHHYMQDPHMRAMGSGMELAGRRKDGSEFPIEAGLSHFSVNDQTVVLATISDISVRKQAEAALRASEERFHRLMESIKDYAIYMMDPQGIIVSGNRGAAQITGYTEEEIIGRHYACFFTAEEVAQGKPQALLQQAMATGSIRVEHVQVRQDGSRFWAHATITAVYDEGGQLRGFAKVTRDVTERRQAAELLEQRVIERTHELERRRQVAEGLQDILARLNTNCTLTEILESLVARALKLLQADACVIYELAGEAGSLIAQVSSGAIDLSSVHPPRSAIGGQLSLDDQGQLSIAELAQQAREQGLPGYKFQQQLLELGCRSCFTMPLMIKGEIYGALATYYCDMRTFTGDDVELLRAFCHQAALAIEHEQLRLQLEATVVAAERNRLARELHDAVTQTLFSASLIAEVLPSLWERNPAYAQKRVQELRELTRGALAEMRTMLLELRPAKLIEIRFADLLQQLAEAVTGWVRVPVQVLIEADIDLPIDVKVALYRIAQEALNNIVKHARAQRAAIRLRQRADAIELTIEDNGLGFEFTGIQPQNLGISIMRERAEAIGALLDIQSQPQQGTTVVLVWPKAEA